LFEDLSYPLTLELIAPKQRISPELAYHLIHLETGLLVPGSFTQTEAKLIRHISLHWDWRVDKQNKPACAAQLLHLLEELCNSPSVIEEVE
jgi:hypothetical protein